MVVNYAIYPSALSNMLFLAMDGKLFEVRFLDKDETLIRKMVLSRFPDARVDELKFKKLRVLMEKYFNGERVEFDVDIVLPFSSPFTKKVLLETRKIPYGETRTYGWLARRLGYSNGGRAIGQALKRNPIPLVIPCHRVIRKDGQIHGFSYGTHIKRKLLEIEGVILKK